MISLYLVGGAVRDEILGVPTKDYDYSVEVTGHDNVEDAYQAMREYLVAAGFRIFDETPEFATIRARFPREPINRANNGLKARAAQTADFVLCRKDSPSSDGRRPDYVEVGTLDDDLARRDFTVNALARAVNLETFEVSPFVIDRAEGLSDLKLRWLRFVGDPRTRLREDGLRALRAVRFKITKGFDLDAATFEALSDPETAALVMAVSVQRRREELERCFHHDTIATMSYLATGLPSALVEAMFSGGLRLAATTRSRLNREGLASS